MIVEVLEDGSIKVSIDPVSMPNHGSAENMLKRILSELGGTITTKHKHGKGGFHSHGHEHNHHVKQ